MVRIVPDASLTVRRGESHLGSLAAAEEILGTILSLWPRARERTQTSTTRPPGRAHRRIG
jgi:hypothetical protein